MSRELSFVLLAIAATLACLASASAAIPDPAIAGVGAGEDTGCPTLFVHLFSADRILDLYDNHDCVYEDGCLCLMARGTWKFVNEKCIALHFKDLPIRVGVSTNKTPPYTCDMVCYVSYINGRMCVDLDGDLLIS